MSQKSKKTIHATITPEPPKPISKKSQIITLLQQPTGASIAELEQATGWQKHSVRGALVHLKNKDKLPVINTVVEGIRRYQIVKPEVQA